MKAGTDGVPPGEWTSVRGANRIPGTGTGSGLIALMPAGSEKHKNFVNGMILIINLIIKSAYFRQIIQHW